MQRQFDILDVAVTMIGPADVIDAVVHGYRRFETTRPDPGKKKLEIQLSDGEIRVNGHSTRLVPGLDPQLQTHYRFQAALMDAIDSCAVLHAAGLVDGRGDGLLLAAPSGHGKSSLTLELVQRGYRFLSDDYAPVDLAQRRILPFPRAVGIWPASRAPIPEPFLAASRAATSTKLFGKSLLDVAELLGESSLAREPAPLRHVVLLTAGAEIERERTVVKLAAHREHASGLQARFAATAGVEILEREEGPHLSVWSLRLDPVHRPTEALAELFDGEQTVLFEKQWDRLPDFAATPAATPIKKSEAAALLGREMLNRRTAGALLSRYEGNAAELFLDLAGAIRDADCWSLRVGDTGATADLVEKLVAIESKRR